MSLSEWQRKAHRQWRKKSCECNTSCDNPSSRVRFGVLVQDSARHGRRPVVTGQEGAEAVRIALEITDQIERNAALGTK